MNILRVIIVLMFASFYGLLLTSLSSLGDIYWFSVYYSLGIIILFLYTHIIFDSVRSSLKYNIRIRELDYLKGLVTHNHTEEDFIREN